MNPLKHLMAVVFAALSMAGLAQPIVYDDATGVVTIPSVQVGSDKYVNLTLQRTGTTPDLTFALTAATLGDPGTAAWASYDPSTGLLTLPAVQVGSMVYDATLRNTGDYRFVLQSATPVPPRAAVTLDPPAPGAGQLTGRAYNVDRSKVKVVIYVLTNQWYVQPLVTAPFTDIASDGTWRNSTHPWNNIVILLVDPANYSPAATLISHPALDSRVIAWTEYPSAGPTSVTFGGRTWGIKVTGKGSRFDPGPNHWSNDPAVVSVNDDGLSLRIRNIDGRWTSGEVYLTEPLGYGIYTVQVSSRLDRLDRNTVASPLFLYASPTQELDVEYSGTGGLIPAPNNAQFVVQPFDAPGHLVRYQQPPPEQFSSQIEWRSDRVTFRSWKGWAESPATSDLIHEWSYSGGNIPLPAQTRVHINLWLYKGTAPTSGSGDELLIRAFKFKP